MIIDRRFGYTNKMMVEYIKLLSDVINTTEEVDVIVNKKKQRMSVPKYNDNITKNNVKKSLEYYNNLLKTEMENRIELRDYQNEISEKASNIIKKYGFVYLAMEVRTGKTLTSLNICNLIDGVENVLFLTKKKAIDSITSDLNKLCPSYALFVVNYESIHKLPKVKWDVIICDESHTMGAFPRPNLRARQVKDLIKLNDSKVILLSGTPTPESYSQMYHQVYGIKSNPFASYTNFYRFSDDYIDKKQKKINGMMINDYSHGRTNIIDDMTKYTIKWSQEDAGFIVKTNEEILRVELQQSTYDIIKKLKKDLVVQGKSEVILADTPVKLLSKLHQLYSGTIKFESGNSMVVDTSKADFIKHRFNNNKIAIFYKFKEEYNALQKVFGDRLTNELSVFDDTDKNIALQIVSGREGISLKKAECIVYYNIDFSATSYWQSKDRMTTKDRAENNIYWVFSNNGIEDKIYKAVSKKKDYTILHFKKDLLLL